MQQQNMGSLGRRRNMKSEAASRCNNEHQHSSANNNINLQQQHTQFKYVMSACALLVLAVLLQSSWKLFANNNAIITSETYPILQSLFANEVIPDVLDPFVPMHSLSVSYGGGSSGESVITGTVVEKERCTAQPTISFNGSKGHLYTIVMTDPDAPSPTQPTSREWLHWLVVNLPGDGKESIATVTAITPYAPPSPPKGTHRYVFVLLQQNAPISGTLSIPSRKGFSVRSFAQTHSLQPVAAVFHLTAP
jgi:phosphatidylethanolamine-binding protein (PEBP) family uncharacterized protein